MEILWSLGHRKTKAVEKNLYTNQLAQKVVESLASGEKIEDWMVWCSGWPKWKSLNEVVELMNEVSLLKKLNSPEAAPPELPNLPKVPPAPRKKEENQVPPASNNTEDSGESLSLAPVASIDADEVTNGSSKKSNSDDDSNWGEKRQHKRVDARFRCIIKSSALTFRTFTRDISLGGVALEDAIPNELLGNQCTIYITSSSSKKNLKFKIKVTQRPGAKFFSFENTDPTFMTELNTWLEQFINHDPSKRKIA
jgi:hypothetical protein